MEEERTSDNRQQEGKTQRVIVNRFFESTTIHGLAQIQSAESMFTRFFWIAVFFAVLVCMVTQVWVLIKKVEAYDVYTHTGKKTYESLEFPSIVICNANPFRKSQFRVNNITFPNMTSCNFTEDVCDKLRKFTNFRHFSQIPLSVVRKLGHQPEEFLLTKRNLCKFQGRPCSFQRNFTQLTTAGFGNCFYFHPSASIIRVVNSGLSLVLNVNQDDYTVDEEIEFDGAGVLVQALQPDRYLDPYDVKSNSIFVAPGTSAKIQLEKRVSKRLPHPYTDSCIHDKRVSSLHGIIFLRPVKYSATLCRFAHKLMKEMELCNSVDPVVQGFLEYFVDIRKSNIIFSNSTEPSEMLQISSCLERAKYQLATGCNPMCLDETFHSTVSTLSWPAGAYASTLLKSLQTEYNASGLFKNWTTSKISKNLLKIEVFFRHLQVEVVEQKPAFTWNDFLCSLGGQFGLFMGVSIISWLEFTSFALIFISHCFKKIKVKAGNN